MPLPPHRDRTALQAFRQPFGLRLYLHRLSDLQARLAEFECQKASMALAYIPGRLTDDIGEDAANRI